jgi:hypothetical protein
MDQVLVAFEALSPNSRTAYRHAFIGDIDLENTPRTAARTYMQLNFDELPDLPEELMGGNERLMMRLSNLSDDADECLTTPLPDILTEDVYERPITPLPDEASRFPVSPTPPTTINRLDNPQPITPPRNPLFQAAQDEPVDIIEGTGDSDYELDDSPVAHTARSQETAADELEEGEILD